MELHHIQLLLQRRITEKETSEWYRSCLSSSCKAESAFLGVVGNFYDAVWMVSNKNHAEGPLVYLVKSAGLEIKPFLTLSTDY